MKIIAHRSGPTVYPEQTILSARLALEQGACMVEADTRFTSDGRIVISHDSSPEHLFGVCTRISEMTGEQFAALRHRTDPAYPSHTLEDYINGGITRLLLHLKEGGEGKLHAILDLLREKDVLKTTVMGAQSPADIRIIKAYDPAVQTLAFMGTPEDWEECAEAGADCIRLWEGWITEERVQQIRNAGRKVWIMACLDRLGYTTCENLRKWESMGIDGVLLNDVTLAGR